MGVNLQKIDIDTDKWRHLVERVNQILDTLSNQVLTTGNNATNGDVIVKGSIFGDQVYSNNQRVVTANTKINTTKGLTGGDFLNADLTLSLTDDIITKIEKGGTSLQQNDFVDKVGLKDKIRIPEDIQTVGNANSTTILFGDGSWKSLRFIGNMSSIVYDPNNINKNVYDMDNMSEGNKNLILTTSEREKIKSIDGISQSLSSDYLKLDGSNALKNNLKIANGNIIADKLDSGANANTGSLVYGSSITLSNSVLNSGCMGELKYAYTKASNTSVLPSNGRLIFNYIANTTTDQLYLDKNGLYASETISGKQIVSRNDVSAFSDIKLKKDITRIENALDKVCHLSGYTFTRIDNDERQTGVIAQEVEQVLPEAVREIDDTKVVAYGNMIGLLIEAIKDIKNDLDIIKSKVG